MQQLSFFFLETRRNITEWTADVSIRMLHAQLLVSSYLPPSCLVVGGAARAEQPALPQKWGPVCRGEDRGTGWLRQNLRLTVPPENSHTARRARTSFLRSGRFSALRRSGNRKLQLYNNYNFHNFPWLDLKGKKKRLEHTKETSCLKEGFHFWWLLMVRR